MNISDYDHEIMYGDKSVAKEMEKEQLKKIYHNNLEVLDILGCSFDKQKFDLKEFGKLHEPEDPGYIKLLARS